MTEGRLVSDSSDNLSVVVKVCIVLKLDFDLLSEVQMVCIWYSYVVLASRPVNCFEVPVRFFFLVHADVPCLRY